MDDEQLRGLLQLCEFCEPRRSLADPTRILRGCRWCEARRDPDAWCECTFCDWL